VTGSQARAAIENAVRLEKNLELLKTTPLEKLQPVFLAYKTDFDQASIPMYRRIDIRKQLGDIELKIKTAAKEQLNVKLQGTATVLESVMQQLKADDKLHVISLCMDVGDNNKILSDTAASIVETAKSTLQRDVAAFCSSKDTTSKKPKGLFAANVSQGLITKGLKANEWVSAVAAGLGGKGGGKGGEVGQGNIPDPAQIDAAVANAKEYAVKKLQ